MRVRPAIAVPAEVRVALATFGFALDCGVSSLHAHAPVFRVCDGRGAWVVKRSGMVHSDASAIDGWLRHLQTRGVATVVAAGGFDPNPRLMPDGHHWVLYPFIEGRPYDGSVADIEAAGLLLAHMHVAGAFNDWGLAAYYRPPHRDAVWIDRHAAAACAAMVVHGVDDGPFGQRLVQYRREAVSGGGLPMAGGSVDYKAPNLVFTPSPVLIDPDHAAFLPRIYDLAIAALLFHCDLATAPGRPWTPGEWRGFLAGYARVVRLDAAEQAAWPEMLRLAWLDQAVWLLGNDPAGWAQPRGRAFLASLAGLDLTAFALPT
jgi:Ser/Thr protein kinase RdoA (MazF antagonist)